MLKFKVKVMITVWRVMNYNKMCYYPQIFATRVQAAKQLPAIANEIMAKYYLDLNKTFSTMSMSEVVESGIFWNKDFGILLIVTHQILGKEEQVKPPVTACCWHSDFESLEDGRSYQIILDSGYQTTGQYDATYGIFVDKNNCFLTEEVYRVKSYKGGELFEDAY